MLLDEARNAAGLAHHRVVQVFDVELREGAVLYAMEYLHGQTLEAVVARAGRLPLDAAITICVAVADGLHHAHERPSAIVHRDVAPSNVMILYDGATKLIDFGIAKAANNLSNTVFGTFKGRLGYSSPEQVRCEPVDRRTDVYSLAVMLYELTTGRPAFTANDEQDMLQRMEQATVTPPRAIDPAYPPELEAIVMNGLARDRNARYPTALAMQHDLEAFAQRAGLLLNDRAIARLMTKLFEAELEPWNRARATGISLEQHIQRTFRSNPSLADDLDEQVTVPKRSHPKTAPPSPASPSSEQRRRPRRRNTRAISIAVVAALFAVAYLVTRCAIA
jgi:serine/threonine-protein kinase